MIIKPLAEMPKDQVKDFLKTKWGSTLMVAKGRLHHVETLPGAAALVDGEIAGMATFLIEGDSCEIVTMNSVVRSAGVGAALLQAVERIATEQGCSRLWCITTNDNTRAIRFYQRNGMSMCGFYPHALEESRKLKPTIPMRGQDGIAIEHELEFEKFL